MKKIIITLTTDASFLTVNKMQNKLLKELLTGNFNIGEYTIQEEQIKMKARVKYEQSREK